MVLRLLRVGTIMKVRGLVTTARERDAGMTVQKDLHFMTQSALQFFYVHYGFTKLLVPSERTPELDRIVPTKNLCQPF